MKKTKANQSLLKKLNRKKILNVLFDKGYSSRVEIKSIIRQDGKTVTNITKDLISDGLITTNGFSPYTGGRRREFLTLNPEYGNIIVIHLDINFLIRILTDFNLKIILKEQI